MRGAVGFYAAVAAGSLIGGVLRHLATVAVHASLGEGFPWGTLVVNATGSFAIGFYAAATLPGHRAAGSQARAFIMTGICGGYTTFSMFSLETLRLAQSGALDLAAMNIGLSVLAWLGAVWLGHACGCRFGAPSKPSSTAD